MRTGAPSRALPAIPTTAGTPGAGEGGMGKRTNSFQRLVKRIYETMMPVGATVEESAMLAEPTSGTRREADILFELMAVGTRLRIAVEVRGRQDRDDIEWIDGVVGKYRDIDVQKIIAVSQSGFTKAAATKARANSIDILTAKEALDTNWPAEFAKLGVAAVTRMDVAPSGALGPAQASAPESK